MSLRPSLLAASLMGAAIVAAPFAAPSAVRAETVKVVISGVAYGPLETAAKVGDTIEWTNADVVIHSVTDRNKSFDLNILPKRTGKITVKAAGTITYYCRYHPNMVGKIAVSP